eukprot:2678514-Pyramimonas_sp.AAC.1
MKRVKIGEAQAKAKKVYRFEFELKPLRIFLSLTLPGLAPTPGRISGAPGRRSPGGAGSSKVI